MPSLVARIIALLGLVTAGTAAAQTQQKLHIIGPERPPYIVDADGIGRGPAVDLVQRLALAVGLDPVVRILPFRRAVHELETGDSLYPALLRTPYREKRFQWIGEVFTDQAVLFTRRGTTAVTGIDDARRLNRISVMHGSELHPLLLSFGLQNIETNVSEADNARLLQAGRIDGWFTLRTVGRATWKLLGFDAQGLQAGESFALMSFWVAGSKNLPRDIVSRLRNAYAALRKTGEYERIIAPLRRPPS